MENIGECVLVRMCAFREHSGRLTAVEAIFFKVVTVANRVHTHTCCKSYIQYLMFINASRRKKNTNNKMGGQIFARKVTFNTEKFFIWSVYFILLLAAATAAVQDNNDGDEMITYIRLRLIFKRDIYCGKILIQIANSITANYFTCWSVKKKLRSKISPSYSSSSRSFQHRLLHTFCCLLHNRSLRYISYIQSISTRWKLLGIIVVNTLVEC